MAVDFDGNVELEVGPVKIRFTKGPSALEQILKLTGEAKIPKSAGLGEELFSRKPGLMKEAWELIVGLHESMLNDQLVLPETFRGLLRLQEILRELDFDTR